MHARSFSTRAVAAVAASGLLLVGGAGAASAEDATPAAPGDVVAPIAVDDEFTTSTNVTITGDFLANDEPGEAEVDVIGYPEHGHLQLTGTGTFSYEPEDGWSGIDTFSYQLNAGELASLATVTLTVRPDAVDDVEPFAAGPNTIDLLFNDLGTDLTITSVTEPDVDGVVVELLEDGWVYVETAEDFVGTVRFEYAIEDASGLTDSATVTLAVSSGTAVADSVVGERGEAVLFDPLANDTPTEGSAWIGDSLMLWHEASDTVDYVIEVPEGVWEVLEDYTVRFTPSSADVTGEVSIEYAVMDEAGGVVLSTLTVTYPAAPVDEPPVDEPPVVEPPVVQPPAAPPAGGSAAPGAAAGDALADTGATPAGQLGLAGLMLLGGTGLVLAARRLSLV